jgi:signal transduction histidine kinase
VGVAWLDRELRVQAWNEAWWALVAGGAASERELPAEDLTTLIPRIASRVREAEPQLLSGEAMHVEEVPFEGADGTCFQDVHLVPLVGEEGVEGFLNLVVDVSERMDAQADLERALLSYRRELSALRDVMSVAAESLELRDVLRRLLDHVLRMMKSKVGAIHLFEEEHAALKLVAWRGIPRDVIRELETVVGPFDPSAWAAAQGEAPVIPEIAGRFAPSPGGSGECAGCSYVGVPVRARGEGLGLISVVGPVGREFDEGDVALLRSIGDQIGVVVENARLHRQAEQLAVVRERERLARELHDSVTQSLYSLTLLAEASQRVLSSGDPERAEEYTGRLGEIAQQALKEMRLLVYQLRPLVLKREGLVGALQQRLDAVEKRAGVDARLLVEGPLELPAAVEEGLYRIAQEALNNALKHAAPRTVTLWIDVTERGVGLEVEDDGAGFDPGAVEGSGGMGLTSMRERAERLGGSLSVRSAPGQGTKVRVDVEVEDE